MSHQISGPRAGLINSKFDKAFLDNLTKDPKKLTRISHLEFMREAGAEGIEMVMWLIMRGALDDKVEETYRFYTVPASNTAVGHIILEPKKQGGRQGQDARHQDEARRRAREDRQYAGASDDEDLRCRAGRLRPEASRRAQAHSGRGGDFAGRRQSGRHRRGRQEIRHPALHRRSLRGHQARRRGDPHHADQDALPPGRAGDARRQACAGRDPGHRLGRGRRERW